MSNFLDLLPLWTKVVFTQVINYGVHLGHSIHSTLNFCSWMIKGQRQGIFLIDLFKFVYMFRAGFFILEKIIRGRGPIWFINLDKLAYLFVKYNAISCGEYWVTDYWIRGMISNYFIIKKSLKKIFNKFTPGLKQKDLLKRTHFVSWGFTRYSWPRAVFISNVLKSYGPCHEAHRLKIPSLGIVDTNTPHSLVGVAIPANDEASSALAFYNSFVSLFVLYTKYAFIHNWYLSSLRESFFSFQEWWKIILKKEKEFGAFRANLLALPFDQLRYLIKGFESQFYQDLWQKKKNEGFLFFTKKKIKILPKFFFNIFKKKWFFFLALKSTWNVSFFSNSFLRPRLRRYWVFQKKRWGIWSFLKRDLSALLLRLSRGNNFFFRRFTRMLRKTHQKRKNQLFFRKYFGLLSFFYSLKRNILFSLHFFNNIRFPQFWTRGHVRFPWFVFKKYERRRLPASFRNFWIRGRLPWNFFLNYGSENERGHLGYGFSSLNYYLKVPKQWKNFFWFNYFQKTFIFPFKYIFYLNKFNKVFSFFNKIYLLKRRFRSIRKRRNRHISSFSNFFPKLQKKKRIKRYLKIKKIKKFSYNYFNFCFLSNKKFNFQTSFLKKLKLKRTNKKNKYNKLRLFYV